MYHCILDVTKQFLKSTIFNTLEHLEQEKWINSVNTDQSCYNYRILKNNIIFEEYLTKLPFHYRVAFSKFRCKNSKIPANKNRFDRNILDRNCHLCQKGDTGDEFHYILICKFFSQERKRYISPYFYTKPNTLKFQELFNNNNQVIMTNLCKFIFIIVKNVK